jgi:phosphatidate phosphatase APP1
VHTTSRFTVGACARRVAAACLVAWLCAGCVSVSAAGPAAHEQVVFFPSLASDSGNGQWLVTVQGRVFKPAEGSAIREAAIDGFAKILKVNPKDEPYRSRARHFFSDSSRNVRVTVKIGSQTVTLPASDPAGYFTGNLVLANAEVMRIEKDGMMPFESLPTAANARSFAGSVTLIPDEGVTVVTDVDDTIKVTEILDRDKKIENTFIKEFEAVPGMQKLYRSWQAALGPGTRFHVVSAGPWQLNEPLRRFFAEQDFPAFTWDMRSVDIGFDPFVALKEAQADPRVTFDHKVKKIRDLMARFPKRHFVFVGDSGERDPEVYSAILSDAAFNDRVDAVFIREVQPLDQEARYRKLFAGDAAAAKFQVFKQPSQLRLPPFASPSASPGR